MQHAWGHGGTDYSVMELRGESIVDNSYGIINESGQVQCTLASRDALDDSADLGGNGRADIE